MTDPTCTTVGYTTHTCSICGESYRSDIITALGHKWKDATCTTAATCTVCGETLGEVPGHSYKSVVTPPTCTTDGYTTYTCTVCGDSYTAEKITAAGHRWSDATCTAPKTCQVCGINEGDTLGHQYAAVETKPDCTNGGYVTHTCERCGNSYIDNAVPALGHDWVEATCTTVKTCATCGATEGTVPGHRFVEEVTFPTCTEIGYTTHTCAVCGYSYVDGHTAALGHVWRDADCLTPKTCYACGITEGSAPGHIYEAVVTPATCTTGGYTTHTCTGCGDSYTDSNTTATGHSITSSVKAPTCTTVGYTTYSCANCDFKYSDNVIAAIGHSWKNGICANCGSECNHSFTDGVCVTCGKLEFGLPASLKLSYPSLAFEDQIQYNIYFTTENLDMALVEQMGLMIFDTRLEDGTVSDAAQVVDGYSTDGKQYMVHTDGIPAKNIGDTLYLKVYAKLINGTYVYSNMVGYNAVAYARSVLNGSNSAAKTLVVSMLNYGAAAQTYFGYNTDNLMNSFLTEEQKALVADYNGDMVGDVPAVDTGKAGAFVMNGGYSTLYPQVSFEGAFAINYYFVNKYSVDEGMTFYYWDDETFANVDVLTADNATGTIDMVYDGSRWCATIAGIAAKEMDQPVYVAGSYTSDGVTYNTTVIAYSLGKYCENLATNGNAFGAATAVYGYYAKVYFSA